jgi:hypothetical protein
MIETVTFIANRNVERERKRDNHLKGNLKAEKLQLGTLRRNQKKLEEVTKQREE